MWPHAATPAELLPWDPELPGTSGAEPDPGVGGDESASRRV